MDNNLSSKVNENSLDSYFDLVFRHAPVVEKTLSESGNLSIADYIDQYPLSYEEGYQAKDDFLDIVYDYLLPVFGSFIARDAVNDLAKTPAALTANHHGVDFFAQSVQGTLLFSQILSARNPNQSTVPVIACANIPLNNLTYPRGMLLYHMADSTLGLGSIPKKLPIFSDRLKNSLVSLVGPIDKDQVDRGRKQVDKMIEKGKIFSQYGEVVQDILETNYGNAAVQRCKNYSEQSVILNHDIWNRMFTDPGTVLDLVYMELEAIVCKLLEKDLPDPESLIHILMFNAEITAELVSELDGKAACWQEDKLQRRLSEDLKDNTVKRQLKNCGTHFFWGVGPKNKLIPMILKGQGSNRMVLKGKDDKGKEYSLAFDPSSIGDALKEGHVLPSLFTCYAALSLARGVKCIGGYYQSEYLPVMQKSIVNVLQKHPSMERAAVHVGNIDAGGYLSGMQTVMTSVKDQSIIPAGPVEIIAGGGLDSDNIEKLKNLSIKEAHLASMLETIPDLVPYGERPDGWEDNISRLCIQHLGKKIVIL